MFSLYLWEDLLKSNLPERSMKMDINELTKRHSDFIYSELKRIGNDDLIFKVTNDIRQSHAYSYILMNIIRYVPERKSWFYYDENRWVKDEGGMIAAELCKLMANELYKYVSHEIPIEEQQYAMNLVLKWHSFNFRKKLLEDAKSNITVSIKEFDTNPYLINCLNGTLNLKTGELQKHNPNDLITKLSPANYYPNAVNDRWESFINEIMSGDKEKAKFLQKVMGYSLCGEANQECLYILYGATTRNGKGTLVESILNVLGDYGRTVRPETLATSNRGASSHSEDIARLNGVRFASISEPPKSMQFNASLVKSLTGGDTINARFLNENSFDFKPQMKIYINTNYLPSVNDKTLFSSNRVVVIPFDRHFELHEQDKTLKSYFKTDELMSAILCWLVCGYYMGMVQGFEQPESVKNAIMSYENKSNPIYIFLNEVLIKDKSGKTPVAEAHRQYTNWAKISGYEPLSQIEFGRRLNKLVKVSSVRVNGVKLQSIIS